MFYDESLVLSSNGEHYKYNRSASNDSIKLSHVLAKRYHVKKCFILPSGMSAIYSSIQSILHFCQCKNIAHQINIIYSSELYCDTPESIAYITTIYNSVRRYCIDITQNTSIIKLFGELKGQFNILFVESCSNPSGYIMDYSIIPQLRELSCQLVVIVDNTWLTDCIFNPFEYGADIVVMSLTKYYSGGCAIGGAVLTMGQYDWYISEHIKRTGLHVSPHNSKIISDRVSTMDDRIRHSSCTTIEVLKMLETNHKILSISHPAINTHPSHSMAIKYFNSGLWPSVFTIWVNTSKVNALKIMQESHLIEHKTSFGGKLSRTDPWPHEYNGSTMCRIAIGYDDKEDMITFGINDLVDKMVPNLEQPKIDDQNQKNKLCVIKLKTLPILTTKDD